MDAEKLSGKFPPLAQIKASEHLHVAIRLKAGVEYEDVLSDGVPREIWIPAFAAGAIVRRGGRRRPLIGRRRPPEGFGYSPPSFRTTVTRLQPLPSVSRPAAWRLAMASRAMSVR